MPSVMARLRKPLLIVFVLALIAVGNIFFPLQVPHVQLPAEKVYLFDFFLVPNTMTAAWLTMIVLIVLSWAGSRNMSMVPTGLQNLVEWAIELIVGQVEAIAGPRRGRILLPLVGTFFLFILINNWSGLLPGYGTILIAGPAPAGEHAAGGIELLPLFRSADTDLNTTLGLAIVSVLATQYYGFRFLGLSYLKRYLNFSGHGAMRGVNVFVGLLEIVSELAKFISLSFRLFGNIFAGEVLLGVISFLITFVAVLPFFALEIFVGLLQAYVFAVLTLIFTVIAAAEHGESAEAVHRAEHGGVGEPQ
ncbi:MAG: F0F1 ATP synthase subunit A [Chloroflexi bacterium]|nr:F0F1 ATP synthase subunit A [Chloroflexota bacterium]